MSDREKGQPTLIYKATEPPEQWEALFPKDDVEPCLQHSLFSECFEGFVQFAKCFANVVDGEERARIIVDYDPRARKTVFTYFHAKEKQNPEED